MTDAPRKPAMFTNYRGDHTDAIGEAKGPTLDTGEFLTVVSADYDADTGMTRLGFAYGAEESAILDHLAQRSGAHR